MGWVRKPVKDTNAIFDELIKEGWDGNIGDSCSPYEYWSDRIRDNYDVTLKQCADICKMIRNHYRIRRFYYGEG